MTPPRERFMGAPWPHGELYDLSDVTYALLRDLIVERTGVWFDAPKRGLLADKLADLVATHGLTSYLDYYYLLRYDEESADANWAALMNRLAVPETFFWRQPEQFEAAARSLVPALAGRARAAGRPLRIWSAACCTGEEPLSIAMALAESDVLEGGGVQIIASDSSPAMIERAQLARYGERSFRQLPVRLRAKYFEADGDLWRPIERLRRAIDFRVANLVEPGDIDSLASSDIIFCRNVFIYFSDDAIRRTVRSFIDRMPDDGYLFLGAAESLTRLSVDLDLVEVAGAFAYVKHMHRAAVERDASRAGAAIRRAAP